MTLWNLFSMSGLTLGYVVLGLIVLGAVIALVYALVQGMLWCMRVVPHLIAWVYAWVVGHERASRHGSAHWAEPEELVQAKLLTPGGIALGTTRDGQTLYESLGGHIALVAPPRSWKSQSFVGPAVVNYPGSVVVNDQRGSVFDFTHQARASRGPVFRFSPTMKGSCALNVLDLVRWGEDEAHGDVQRIVHTLISPKPGEVLTPFQLEAQPLLVALVWDRQAAGEGHFPAVLQWMTDPARSMKQKIEGLLKSPLPQARAGARRMADKSDRLQASVWSAALSALNVFEDPLIAAHTHHSDVNLARLQFGAAPLSLYLTPPFADVDRLAPLLGAFVATVIARLSAQQETPQHKVLLALDEVANLPRLPDLERGVSFLQGCGAQVLAIFQNLAQFRHVYGLHSPLLAAIGTHVYYTPSDQETAEQISEACGKTTVRWHPLSTSFSFWGVLQHTTEGTSEHARDLLTADEARRLGEFEAVILVKGVAPIQARKLGADAAAPVAPLRPTLVRAACVAGVAAAFVGALWLGVQGLSSLPIRSQSAAPRLSKAEPVAQARDVTPSQAGETVAPHPATGVTADTTPQAAQDEPPIVARIETIKSQLRDEGVEEKDLLRELLASAARPEAHYRWRIWVSEQGSPGIMASMQPHRHWPPQPSFEGCEEARQTIIAGYHQGIAQQPAGPALLKRLPHGFRERVGAGYRDHLWHCILDEPGPS